MESDKSQDEVFSRGNNEEREIPKDWCFNGFARCDPVDFQLQSSALFKLQSEFAFRIRKNSRFIKSLEEKREYFRTIESFSSLPEDIENEESGMNQEEEISPNSHGNKDALFTLGLDTGLSLCFALIQQNMELSSSLSSSNIQSPNLYSQVFGTAMNVLRSLSPLSLSALPPLGERALETVSEFLISSSLRNDFSDSRKCYELLLCLTTQTGKCSDFLRWIHTALSVASLSKEKSPAVDCLIFNNAVKIITPNFSSNLMTDSLLDLKDSALRLLEKIINCTFTKDLPGDNYLWGKWCNIKKIHFLNDVSQIEAGHSKLLVIHTDGRLSCVEKDTSKNVPLISVKMVSVSKENDDFFLALNEEGKVFSWGCGSRGQLGHGDEATHICPKEILTLSNVKHVSAGYQHSAVVTFNGLAYTWGEGSIGRLGHYDELTRLVPTLVRAIKDVGSISCGSHHTLALSRDGRRVWSFGCGYNGELGHGNTDCLSCPKEIEYFKGFALKKVLASNRFSVALGLSGEVWAWGKLPWDSSLTSPILVKSLSGVKDISAANRRVLALLENDSVYMLSNDNVAGVPFFGNVRNPIKLDISNVNGISVGEELSCAWSTSKKLTSFNWPHCDEPDSKSFSIVSNILLTFGLEWSNKKTCFTINEREDFLLQILGLLSSFLKIASPISSSKWSVEKAKLEDLLYQFMDADNVSNEIKSGAVECIQVGSNFFQLPLIDRLTRCYDLLHCISLSEGQKYKLYMVLKSLNEPRSVSPLLIDEGNGKVSIENLLKHLIPKMNRHLVSCIVTGKFEAPSLEMLVGLSIHNQYLFFCRKQKENFETRSYMELILSLGQHLIENMYNVTKENASWFNEEDITSHSFIAVLDATLLYLVDFPKDVPIGIKELRSWSLRLNNILNSRSVFFVYAHTLISSLESHGVGINLCYFQPQDKAVVSFCNHGFFQHAVFGPSFFFSRHTISNYFDEIKNVVCSKISLNDLNGDFSPLSAITAGSFSSEYAERILPCFNIDKIKFIQEVLLRTEGVQVKDDNVKILYCLYWQGITNLCYKNTLRTKAFEPTICCLLEYMTQFLYFEETEEIKTESYWKFFFVGLLIFFIDSFNEEDMYDPDIFNKSIRSLLSVALQTDNLLISDIIAFFEDVRSHKKILKDYTPVAVELLRNVHYLDIKLKLYEAASQVLCELMNIGKICQIEDGYSSIKPSIIPYYSSRYNDTRSGLAVEFVNIILLSLDWDNISEGCDKFLTLVICSLSIEIFFLKRVDLILNEKFLTGMNNLLCRSDTSQSLQTCILRLIFLSVLQTQTSQGICLSRAASSQISDIITHRLYSNSKTNVVPDIVNFICLISPKALPSNSSAMKFKFDSWVEGLLDNLKVERSASILTALKCLREILNFSSIEEENRRRIIVSKLLSHIHDASWKIMPSFVPKGFFFESNLSLGFSLDNSYHCRLPYPQTVFCSGELTGYCLADRCIPSGVVTWTFNIIKESKGMEGICVGVSPKMTNNHSTKEMWLYKALSGLLSYKGKVYAANLPEFTQGDSVNCIINREDSTLSFAKNHEPPMLAFTDLPRSVELYPVVTFSSTKAEVSISNMLVVSKENPQENFQMEPHISPVCASIAQETVEVIRSLYHHPSLRWKSIIDFMFRDRILESEPYVRKLLAEFEKVHTNPIGIASLIDELMKSLYPVLAIVSNVDSGLRLGSRVVSKDSKVGIVVGIGFLMSTMVRVRWVNDGSVTIKNLHTLKRFNDRNDRFSVTEVIKDSFASKFCEILSMLSNFSGTLGVSVPETPFSDNDNSKKSTPEISSSHAVELLTDSLVTSIIDEVTGKSVTSGKAATPVMERKNKDFHAGASSIFKTIALQFSAIKTLTSIFSDVHLSLLRETVREEIISQCVRFIQETSNSTYNVRLLREINDEEIERTFSIVNARQNLSAVPFTETKENSVNDLKGSCIPSLSAEVKKFFHKQTGIANKGDVVIGPNLLPRTKFASNLLAKGRLTFFSNHMKEILSTYACEEFEDYFEEDETSFLLLASFGIKTDPIGQHSSKTDFEGLIETSQVEVAEEFNGKLYLQYKNLCFLDDVRNCDEDIYLHAFWCLQNIIQIQCTKNLMYAYLQNFAVMPSISQLEISFLYSLLLSTGRQKGLVSPTKNLYSDDDEVERFPISYGVFKAIKRRIEEDFFSFDFVIKICIKNLLSFSKNEMGASENEGVLIYVTQILSELIISVLFSRNYNSIEVEENYFSYSGNNDPSSCSSSPVNFSTSSSKNVKDICRHRILKLVDALSGIVLYFRSRLDVKINLKTWAIKLMTKCISLQSLSLHKETLTVSHSDILGVLPQCAMVRQLKGHSHKVVAISYGKNFLATGSCDGTVRLWNSNNLERILIIYDNEDYAGRTGSFTDKNLAWSKSGIFLAVSVEASLNIWTIRESSESNTMLTQPSHITGMAWSIVEEEEVLIIARQNGSLGALFTPLYRSVELQHLYRANVYIYDIKSTDKSDGSFVVSYSDGTIIMFSIDKTDARINHEFESGGMNALSLYGEYLAIYSPERSTVKVIQKDMTVRTLSCTIDSTVEALSWSSEFHYLAVGLNSGKILIWSLAEEKEPKFLYARHPIDHLEFHPTNSEIIASGTSRGPSGIVNIWSLLSKSVIHTTVGNGGVTSIRWFELNRLACGFTNSENATVITLQDDIVNVIITSGCRAALIGSFPYERNAPRFKMLINKFGDFLQKQYEYEKWYVKDGYQLIYSQFLQTLCIMAHSLNLEQIFESLPSSTWNWIFIFTRSINLIRLLSKRNVEADREIRHILHVEETSENNVWTAEADAQLMKWATEFPMDWQPGGKSLVYLFGQGQNGQLGELGSSSIRPKLVESFGDSSTIICGQQITYVLHSNGSLSVCGEGTNGRLGLGNSEDHFALTPISSLGGFTILQVSTSTYGGGGHTLALASSGEVFSWGDGDDGKLGHGNTEKCRRPRMISSLSRHFIVFVATGSSHSAVISDRGKLFTFGCGEGGRLGHSSAQAHKIPEMVMSLTGYRVSYVACGFDHTVCITSSNGSNLWSFGDGEYGKLGLGHCCSKFVPKKIKFLPNEDVKKVSLGMTFSVFLTLKGKVYICGNSKFCGIDDCNINVSTPKKIPGLDDIRDIATGGEHVLALSNSGHVWGWGNNSEGQLGNDSGYFSKKPILVQDLSDKGILQISTGQNHTAAWTSPPNIRDPQKKTSTIPPRLGTPETLRCQFATFFPTSSLLDCRSRLALLDGISNTVSEAWKLFPIFRVEKYWPESVVKFYSAMRCNSVRESFSPSVYMLPLVQTLISTMNTGGNSRNYGPQVAVRRLFPLGDSSIFSQIAEQVFSFDPQDLRYPSRAWKVKLIGEAADDAGGVFDDTITEICRELVNGTLDLLMATPNGISEIGLNRDKYLLNSEKNSKTDLQHFWFLGILCGVAIRTGKPIAVNLAPLVWKLLLGVKVDWKDLEDVDLSYSHSLRFISDSESSEDDHLLLPMEYFTGISFSGKEIPLYPGSEKIRLTVENKKIYAEAALSQRIREMKPQIDAMRDGLAALAPYPILRQIPFQVFEALVCGQPSFPLWILKKITRYRDIDPSHSSIIWLWEILEEFNDDMKVLFLIFVSGRSRLPANAFDMSQRFQILRVPRPTDGLPTAQTCFFQLRLPPYTSKEIMKTKFIYAIRHCRTIDMDNYMLARNNDGRINANP